MTLTIPKALKAEHDHLHEDLMAAMAKGSRTGEAAHTVARHLHPHFLKEEEFAMPLLGLLAILVQSEGRDMVSPEDAKAAIAMADRLSSEMPRMLAEHQEIVAGLHTLIAEAQEESHGDVVEFAQKLMLHAQDEEEVLYPAAILVGRYLRLEAQVGPEPVSVRAV
jgi:hypothetical protein